MALNYSIRTVCRSFCYDIAHVALFNFVATTFDTNRHAQTHWSVWYADQKKTKHTEISEKEHTHSKTQRNTRHPRSKSIAKEFFKLHHLLKSHKLFVLRPALFSCHTNNPLKRLMHREMKTKYQLNLKLSDLFRFVWICLENRIYVKYFRTNSTNFHSNYKFFTLFNMKWPFFHEYTSISVWKFFKPKRWHVGCQKNSEYWSMLPFQRSSFRKNGFPLGKIQIKYDKSQTLSLLRINWARVV